MFNKDAVNALEEFRKTVSDQITQLNDRVSRLEGPAPSTAVADYEQLMGKTVIVEHDPYFLAGKLVGYTESALYVDTGTQVISMLGSNSERIRRVLREQVTAVFEPRSAR